MRATLRDVRLSDNSGTTGPATLLGLFVTIGSLEAIENYDYFWHLATGRWIVEHRALPASDPFTLASHDHSWVNLEWLFHIFLYPLHQLLGHVGLTLLLALLVGLGVTFLFLYARSQTSTGAALFLTVLAWGGAAHRIDVRPETAAIPLLVVFLMFLLRPADRRSIWISFLITVLWFSIHPSALLAPVMAGLVMGGSMLDRNETRREIAHRLGQTIASAVALLFNPWGLSGLLAPLELATLLRREGLVNLEWLPSSPEVFPELYVILIASLFLVLFGRRGRLRWARLLLLVFLGALAVRYVRNHAFFYPALPVLLAPSLGAVALRWDRILMFLSAVLIAVGFVRQEPGLGVAVEQFPVRSVELLEKTGLEGNVYTPDQFGGFLVWSFYPERRALIDGRNELYVDFFRRFEEARADSRGWKKMFIDYELTLAIEEYRSDYVEMIDGLTGERRRMPASSVYFPRQEWALIGFDQSSMLFAKRDAHPGEIIDSIELRFIVPDARLARDVSTGTPGQAWEDLRKLEAQTGSFPRMQQLRQLLLKAGSAGSSVDDAVAVE